VDELGDVHAYVQGEGIIDHVQETMGDFVQQEACIMFGNPCGNRENVICSSYRLSLVVLSALRASFQVHMSGLCAIDPRCGKCVGPAIEHVTSLI
jgi:hypothetical protein